MPHTEADELGTGSFTGFTPSESLLHPAVVDTPVSEPAMGDPITASERSISAPSLSEGSAALPQVSPEELEEVAEYQNLQRAVIAHRRAREMEAMRRELAGEDPGTYVELPGTTRPSRMKRAAEEDDAGDERYAKKMVVAHLPKFAGKNLQELEDYSTQWRISAEQVPLMSEQRLIRLAAGHLERNAARRWLQLPGREAIQNWDAYIECLRGFILNAENRKAVSLRQLYEAQRKPGQKVADLLAYVENLERNIPPMDEEERKAWHFLNALDEASRAEILRLHPKGVFSREQVFEEASRLENINSSSRSAASRSSNATSNSGQSRPVAPKRTQSSTSASSVKGSQGAPGARGAKGKFQGTCRRCDREGHKREDCFATAKKDGTALDPLTKGANVVNKSQQPSGASAAVTAPKPTEAGKAK